MEKLAVIDTETNWKDEVMSIGVVIANAETFNVCKMKYYILTPEYLEGGMFSYALKIKWDFDCNAQECSRENALADLKEFLQENQISKIFAYNASFDYHHLPELNSYTWYDIMRLAAYRQYNSKIPQDADLCSTGRLKRGFGVECMKELLTGVGGEQHNALCDAVDELLCIMKPLGYKINDYIPYTPKNNIVRKKPDIFVKLEFIGKPKSYKIMSPTWEDVIMAADILKANSNNILIMECLPVLRNIAQIKAYGYEHGSICVDLKYDNALKNTAIVLRKKLSFADGRRLLLDYNKGKRIDICGFDIELKNKPE
ncbi:MAG: hypothetical protein J1F33_08360 [Clostridiales bacterium]|nr:hypothetical protein [Clostridiales bacterium]